MDCKQETPFRIGGVYRQRNGQVVRLTDAGLAVSLKDGLLYGERRLTDGADENAGFIPAECGDRSLLPGELTQTPSGWVALGAEKQEEEPQTAKRSGVEHDPVFGNYTLAGTMRTSTLQGDPREIVRLFRKFDAEQTECAALIPKGPWIIRSELRKVEPSPADITVTYDEFLALSADPNAAMIARDGSTKPAAPVAVKPLLQPTAKPNPFQNYTAPDCSSDPDHLNASRHQMAGMKG